MKWALNVKKGTVINHPLVGKMDGGIAIPIQEKDVNQLKHIYNVVIFDGFVPVKEETEEKKQSVKKKKNITENKEDKKEEDGSNTG